MTGEQPKDWKKEVFSWIRSIVIALILAYFISQFVIANAEVPTGSMENTIEPMDRIIANRLSYVGGAPKRGDIIIFHPPDNPEGIPYVKRVIGLPGETVEGANGVVYIDGQALEEDYVKGQAADNFGPYTIPEDRYFVMGDNREHSNDSRYWHNKYVEKDQIMGRVMMKYYPHFEFFERIDPLE